MKIKLKDIFNVPNMLCGVRLLLIPLFIVTFINAESVNDYYIASLIVIISGLTDFLDGFIARKFNQITELGKALDPIADKLTQAAIVICLMYKIKWMFILVIVFVIKELFMTICCLVLLKRNKKLDGARWYGKISTTVFYITMVILIAFPSLNYMAVNILMIITGAFLIFSLIKYSQIFIGMLKEKI